jgi:hypothetical protein
MTAVRHVRYREAEAVCAALSVPLIIKPFELDVLLDAVAAAARRLTPTLPSQP